MAIKLGASVVPADFKLPAADSLEAKFKRNKNKRRHFV
jgi:hypothetical protein